MCSCHLHLFKDSAGSNLHVFLQKIDIKLLEVPIFRLGSLGSRAGTVAGSSVQDNHMHNDFTSGAETSMAMVIPVLIPHSGSSKLA